MEVKFNKYSDVDTWLGNIQVKILSEKFKQDGYAIIENFISEIDCLGIYQDCVSKMHSGVVDTKNWRHDLGSHQPKIIPDVVKKNGVTILEVGRGGHYNKVKEVFSKEGYSDIETICDLNKDIRVLMINN